FSEANTWNDDLLDKFFWQYVFYLLFLFVVFGMIGAGLTEDMMGEADKPAKASAKKAPAKKAPAKKKATKKATAADD
ncbi:MAG: hypothetical protein ACXAC2_23855, partial [Candidatus Kariarchaeaceae archaeon]